MIAWFARNPIAANLLMALILVGGIASLPSLRQITYPNIAFDLIDVTVEYPGATPDEVEQSVCVRVEEAIRGIEGIERVESRAIEGRGNVTASLENDADAVRVREQIRTRVDALRTLPDGALPPVIEELIDNSVLLSVVIAGDAGEKELRNLGERIRDELARLPEVSLVELAGVRPYEISIEVSEIALRRHHLSFDDVARAVRASSLDLPTGTLKTRDGEILLRTDALVRRAEEFERLPLFTRADGTRLHLGEVATVVDGFAEVEERANLDGEPAVAVRVMTRNDRQVIATSQSVRAYLERAQSTLPPGIRMVIWDDESQELVARRSLLLHNGLAGLVLVVAVLGLFLGFRLALWVTAGIPVAFLGAILTMAMLDVSLDMLTLFAFIVSLGLVVDDAIVVGESIATQQRVVGDPLRAATLGVGRVALPVTVSVITTIFFVSPQLFVPGFFGKLVQGLAIVLIACLGFSLVESLLVLPAHLAHPGRGKHEQGGLHRRVDAGLQRFIKERYVPLLRRALDRPGLTLTIASVGLMLSLALVLGGWIPTRFLPDVEAEVVSAELELEKGTPAAVTWATLRRIEREALGLRDEIDAGGDGRASVFKYVVTSLGSDPDHHDDFKRGAPGGHVGRVRVQLPRSNERNVSSLQIAERWRARVGEVMGAVSLHFSGVGLIDDPPIDIELRGAEPAVLEAASRALRTYLETIPGVREIGDSHRAGKRELALRIRPEAEALGLTLAELARQVRQGFHGERVQSFQRGREEVEVVVRYPRDQRRSLGDLESVRIRTPRGGEVPFGYVAHADLGLGDTAIHRVDRQRSIAVTATVEPSITTPGEVLASVETALPELLVSHPGVTFERSGMNREEEEVFGNRIRGYLTALLAAYALMAITLRSYADPILVLVAIPFGIGGAVAAHALLGLALSSFSMIGMVALTGVVVNDSLVLICATQKRRLAGDSPTLALCEAAAERFRPILLTSLTTFFGLLPLLFEPSSEAQWLKPIGVTLAFGVPFATGVTLLVVPAASIVLERFRNRTARGGDRPGRNEEEGTRYAHRFEQPGF